MSISFISGKPGGGKSLYGVHLVVKDLRTTTRNIVTNLALDIPRLCEYLHETHGSAFNASTRIAILKPEDTADFFLCYGPDLLLDHACRVPVARKGRGTKKETVKMELDYAPRELTGGVLYVIDEAHKFFNAREWADNGTDVLFYASEHRKLHDDVILITQHVQNVDKQFTRIAEDFTYLRNFGKGKVPFLGGIFRTPAKFLRTTFPDLQTAGKTGEASETRFFGLDREGLASCYRTCQGVGIVGDGPEEQKRGGLPFWCLPAFVLVGLLALFFGTDFIGKKALKSDVVKHTMGTNSPRNEAEERQRSVGPVAVKQVVTPAVMPGSLLDKVPQAAPFPEVDKDVFWTARVVVPKPGGGKSIVVYLSDGRKFTEQDAELQGFGRDSVLISGKIFGPKPLGQDPPNLFGVSKMHANR